MKWVILFLVLECILINTNQKEIGHRILNGTVVDNSDDRFRFEVGIYVINNQQQSYFCSGSHVGGGWILTSGSCLYNAASAVVYSGSYSLKGSNTSYVVTSDMHVHENYNSKNLSNNLGLLKIDQDRLSTNKVDFTSSVTTDSESVVIGWGQTTQDESSTSDVLRSIEINTINKSECQSYYGKTYINDNIVCTDPKSGKNPCLGDAGSPLLKCDSTMCQLYGILNFFNGYRCDYPYPAVYTIVPCGDINIWINYLGDTTTMIC